MSRGEETRIHEGRKGEISRGKATPEEERAIKYKQ